MKNDLMIVQAEGGGHHLRYGTKDPVDPHESSERVFKTVSVAKQYGYQRFGVLPKLHVADSVPFDRDNPLHAAMHRIESRTTVGKVDILFVTKTHYWIRRVRGVEQPIAYKVVRGKEVRARGTLEELGAPAAVAHTP